MPSNKVRVNIRLKTVPKATPYVATTTKSSYVTSNPWWKSWIKLLGFGVGTYFVFWVMLTAINTPSQPSQYSGFGYMQPTETFESPAPSTQSETSNPATSAPLPSRPYRLPEDGSISYEQTVTGWFDSAFNTSDNQPTQIDVWAFNGKKGDIISARVIVNLTKSDQSQNSMGLSLAEPPDYNYIVQAGTLPSQTQNDAVVPLVPPAGAFSDPNTQNDINYCAIISFALPKSGRFALVVFSMNTSSGIVSYSLSLTKDN